MREFFELCGDVVIRDERDPTLTPEFTVNQMYEAFHERHKQEMKKELKAMVLELAGGL